MNKTRLYLRQLKSIGFVDAGACEGADIIIAKRNDPPTPTDQAPTSKDRKEEVMADNDTTNEAPVVAKAADAVSGDVLKRLEDAEKRAEAAEKAAASEREIRLNGEWIAKAKALPNLTAKAEDFGLVLKRAADVLKAEDMAEIVRVLTAASAQLGEAGVLTRELGVDGESAATSAVEKLRQAAQEIRKSNAMLTPEQAYLQACDANPALYKEARKEESSTRH